MTRDPKTRPVHFLVNAGKEGGRTRIKPLTGRSAASSGKGRRQDCDKECANARCPRTITFQHPYFFDISLSKSITTLSVEARSSSFTS